MLGKRMRPLMKEEPGVGGAMEAQEQHQQQAAEVEAVEREGRRRRGEEEGAVGSRLELQLLSANAEAQAFAFREMERVRALGEELLRLKEQRRCRLTCGSKTPRSQRRYRPMRRCCRARTW
jgi:hypothetical protein